MVMIMQTFSRIIGNTYIQVTHIVFDHVYKSHSANYSPSMRTRKLVLTRDTRLVINSNILEWLATSEEFLVNEVN